MTFHEMLTSVGEQFAGWTQSLRPEASLEWLQSRHDRLGRDLRRRYDLLISQRAILEGLRHRIEIGEGRARTLAERAEVYLNLRDGDNAWKNALELERVRTALEREREQLALHEESYAQQRRDIDAIKTRMADLRERMERRGRWSA